MLVLFLLAGTAYTQILNQSDKPNLVVTQKSWHIEFRNPALDEDPFRANNELRQAERERRETERQNAVRVRRGLPAELPPVRVRPIELEASKSSTKYIYEVKLKNTGEKRIQGIIWEYVFYEPGTKRELGRQQFASKTSISPGKTKHLVVRSALPPTVTVSVTEIGRKLTDLYLEQIIIQSIEYEDGSIWQTALQSN
jgi:hypothetical protein